MSAHSRLDVAGLPSPASAQTSVDIVSHSLPTPDRDLVRTDEMFLHIRAAANSRAPRR